MFTLCATARFKYDALRAGSVVAAQDSSARGRGFESKGFCLLLTLSKTKINERRSGYGKSVLNIPLKRMNLAMELFGAVKRPLGYDSPFKKATFPDLEYDAFYPLKKQRI